jgi:serine protease inhibitor
MKINQIFFASFLLLTACKSNDINPVDKPNLTPLSSSAQTLSASGSDFSFNLIRQVSNGESSNLFLSPLSVQLALGMVLNGASGATADGILKTIDYKGLQATDINQGFLDLMKLLTTMDNKIELDLANSVWYDKQYAVNPDFSNTIKNFYDGDVQGLDFQDPASAGVINNWVSTKTDNQIKNLVDHTDGDIMMLINAIYFKGAWTTQFDKSRTAPANFYGEDGTTSSVSTMYCKAARVTGYGNSNLSVYSIPYGNEQFSMTILLPSATNTVAKLLNSVSEDSLNVWLQKSDSLTRDLYLPKFSITSSTTLNTVLSTLGMGTAFSDAASFPFLFTDAQGLKITKVLQQAVIDVDEDGTTASAATSVSIGFSAVGPSAEIRIDHPFIFLIREKHSGAILFIGQLFQPQTD